MRLKRLKNASADSAAELLSGSMMRFWSCNRRIQSTESPILFRSCGHETPFSDQKMGIKIGDSVLWPYRCTRARNPRFYFAHAGTKPRFLTKKGIKNREFRAMRCTIADISVANKKSRTFSPRRETGPTIHLQKFRCNDQMTHSCVCFCKMETFVGQILEMEGR